MNAGTNAGTNAGMSVEPFQSAYLAWAYLVKIGASIQEALILPGGIPQVRCDYSPALDRLQPRQTGRNADCIHQRADYKGVAIVWDEPASVERARTLRKAMNR